MTLITKEDMLLATKQRKLHVVKNFYPDHPSWEDIDHLYDLAKVNNTILYNSFGTMVIREDAKVLKYYEKAVSIFSSCHRGNVLFLIMIIHFINRNNNVMTDKNLSNLFSKFVEDNPKKVSEELTIKDDGISGWPNKVWDPKIHSDAQDRLFIQGSGQSLWKVFNDNKELNYEVLLSEGDAAYIPKGVTHSVESMSPRHSVSIAFSDDPEITQD